MSQNPNSAPHLEPISVKKTEGYASLSVMANSILLTAKNGTQIVAGEGASGICSTVAGVTGASQDGRWLGIYGPFSSSLYIYRLPDMQRVARLDHSACIGHFTFSPGGDEVAIVSHAQVEFWSTATWQRKRTLPNFGNVLYTPDPGTLWLV